MRIAKICLSQDLLKEGIPKHLLAGMFDLLPAETKWVALWSSSYDHQLTFSSPAFKEIPSGAVTPEIIPYFKTDSFGNTYCEKMDFGDILESEVKITITDHDEPYSYQIQRLESDGGIKIDPKVTIKPVAEIECDHIFKEYSVPFSKPLLICLNCGKKERT